MELLLPKARVLITVKTYPMPSKTYDELVCTAGLLNGDTWIRIYPIPFREMTFAQRFSKWEWIELDLEKRPPGKDQRPESYQPRLGINEPIRVLGPLECTAKTEWAIKRRLLLKDVHDSLDGLIEQTRSTNRSLGVVRPRKIFDIKVSKEPDRWTEAQRQGFLDFVPQSERRDRIKPVKPLPYRFHFVFETLDGKERTMMVEDWELGALYWHSLPENGDEKVACELVRKKFEWMINSRDLHFIVGTTWRNHARAENPFVIVGLFYPPMLDPPGQIPLF